MTRIFFFAVLVLSAVCVQSAEYQGPESLAVSPDGKTLFVANSEADEIAVIDTAQNKVVKTISTGGVAPMSIVCAGSVLYAAGGGVDGQLIKIDTENGKVSQKIPAGHTPCAVAVSPDGKSAFVCNRFTTDVWQYDLPDMKLVRKIKVVREPFAAVVTKDSKYVLVCNSIPLDVGNKPEDPNALIDVAAEVSVITVASGSVQQIRLPNGSGSLHGITLSPDGKYAYVTEVLARFQIPTTQVERGWMNTAGIAIIDTTQLEGKNRGFVNSVLLDDVDLGAANPWGIAMSADGARIYVAAAGTSELMTVDAKGMHEKLKELGDYDMSVGQWDGTSKANDVPNDLSFLVGLKKRKVLNGKGARAVAVAGSNVYVGMYFTDTVEKISTDTYSETTILLGKEPVDIAKLPAERRGEIWWNDAALCFQKWQSCASCHPDMRMDGYNWDLLNDDLGNPKNVKSLLHTLKTPPSMWECVRDPLVMPEDRPEQKAAKLKKWEYTGSRIQCVRTGFQFIQFAMPDEAKCQDIDAYIGAQKAVPSPHLVNGKLSELAEKGKKIFSDSKVGCAKCHLPDNYFTDQKMHDVNTKCDFDRRSDFDTPTLHEVWRTAPYLHDGRYKTMRDVFKIGKHGDGEYGDVGGLSDEQIDALVEYVLSL